MHHKIETTKHGSGAPHHVSLKTGAHHPPAGKGHAKSIGAMSSPHGHSVNAGAPRNPLHAKLTFNNRGSSVPHHKGHAKRYPIPVK